MFAENIAGLHSPNVSLYASYAIFDEQENEQYFIENAEHSWDDWV